MNPELYTALLGLILAILAGLTGFVAWLFRQAPEWLSRLIESHLTNTERKLDENTRITEEARNLSNGRFDAVLQRLNHATERLRFYRAVIEEMQKNHEARELITRAAEAVRARQHDPERAALARLLDGDTPT